MAALDEAERFVRENAGVELRPATGDDAAAVLAFWALAAEDAHRPADDVVLIQTLVRRDPGALVLAVDGALIVGSVVAGWDGWRAHLYRLAVHPDHRRHGIGSALLAAAEQRLASLGARRFDAMVLEGNVDAQALWRAAGYAPQAEWSRWVKAAAWELDGGDSRVGNPEADAVHSLFGPAADGSRLP